MSAALPPALEALAFRWPAQVPGCTCVICNRATAGPKESFPYPSPFVPYRLMRWDGVQEREPTDAERADFNAQYPALAFSRTAEQGGKLPTPWIRACLKLLKQLTKLKSAQVFLRPVDPVALNIPDYPTIIKHPRDFSTIEAKLLATEAAAQAAEIGDPQARPQDGTTYATPEEFASDVRMIFRNAFLYNREDHFVRVYAKEVSIKFESGYAQL
jgi:hypothetical protein